MGDVDVSDLAMFAEIQRAVEARVKEEIRRLQAEAVARDEAEEKGEASERLKASLYQDVLTGTQCIAGRSCWDDHEHSARCIRGQLLRRLGGPAEVARQVNRAHAVALREHARITGSRFAVAAHPSNPQALADAMRAEYSQPLSDLVVDPFQGRVQSDDLTFGK